MMADTVQVEFVTERQKTMMGHCVANAPFKGVRNYYCAGDDDLQEWDDLVNKGLAEKRIRQTYGLTSVGMLFAEAGRRRVPLNEWLLDYAEQAILAQPPEELAASIKRMGGDDMVLVKKDASSLAEVHGATEIMNIFPELRKAPFRKVCQAARWAYSAMLAQGGK